MTEMSHPEASAEGLPQASAGESFTALAKKDDRPVYEVGFHIVPTVSEADIASVVEKVRAPLAEAEIIKEEFPHKVQFAYVIERAAQGKREKYNEGYFGWIKFAVERESIPALEAALRGIKEVLRYLLTETI